MIGSNRNGPLLSFAAANRVGGYDELRGSYMEAKPNTTLVYEALVRNASAGAELSASQREAALRYGPCGVPDPLAWHLVRPADDANFPWPGTTFGIAIGAVWYWCSDQVLCSSPSRLRPPISYLLLVLLCNGSNMVLVLVLCVCRIDSTRLV